MNGFTSTQYKLRRANLRAWQRSRSWASAVCMAALFIATQPARAGLEGLPLAHTGANGEPTCSEAGCHRNTAGGEAEVSIEVGPYVPGAPAQPVIVTIVDPAATSWGFQLAARRKDNLSVPAGTFEAVNNFARVRCADGNAPPCDANEMQYATHTALGVATGPAPSKTFTVNWTAPPEDLGDVVFTAAAVGADGDMGTNGDRTATATALSLFAPSNSPTISSAVSAAGFSHSGQGIAPNSLVTIFGEKLAAPDLTRNVTLDDLDPQGRIPEQLNRLTIEFTTTSNAVPRRGRIIFLNSQQVNLQAPNFPIARMEGEMVRMVVVLNPDQDGNEVRSNVIEQPIQPVAPALFTLASSGEGDVAALHADGRIVASTGEYPSSFPAAPSEVILLYGSGFGATDPSYEAGQFPEAAELVTPPTAIEIGGLTAEVLYAGAAPGFAGLYQFNVRVPDLPAGDHPIVIRSTTFSTQANVTLAVAP